MTHIRLTDLPAPIRTALEGCGYHKADVEVSEAPIYSPAEGTAGFTGNRGYCVVVNVGTGERHESVGAWGGTNPFGAKAVDHDRAEYPIPPNCAVVYGESGGRGAFFRVKVAPGMLVGVLPAAGDTVLSRETSLALSVIGGIRGGHRADYFSRLKLGAYGPQNPHVVDLVGRKLLTANKGGAIAITTEGRNVRASLPTEITRMWC
jgi:hypothetical protein